jgi:biopolymer transport protein ExbB
LDEVTLLAAGRSAAHVSLQALGQAADSPLVAADEEADGAGEVSYFAILIGSVTIDGWIVIALLAVMAVVSVYVMVSKAAMLRTAGRANEVFLATFKAKSFALLTPGHADIAAVQQDPRSERSSVYRLYAIGLSEVAQRFDVLDQAGRPRRLGHAGLQAIRASLDAAMMRENQRFNSGIVLDRARIYEEIWGYDFGPDSKNLAVYISYLRRKLDDDRDVKLIHTVRGVGYTLRVG